MVVFLFILFSNKIGITPTQPNPIKIKVDLIIVSFEFVLNNTTIDVTIPIIVITCKDKINFFIVFLFI
jgi:hypothetical protein